MNGTATIEIALTLLNFIAQHASKKNMHNTHPPALMLS